ncbi:CHASE3 domain-containing protein [Paucibacter sp. TC2R-5]|uniref:CHASE3 domain-containing protein n=1 Tax=Paucibacter sp. TC2R-5 TaxID=2893555 RepID=UPI0021E3D5A7|nr:CHASE3 domain-containing protein [Paucibacter sp. TC2R-5]MCV2360602.1 CHASE3 domain-containing protein [Paucibacter sp. TC2R-5]
MNFLSVAKRSPLVFPLACAATVALIFLSESSYFRATSSLQELAVMTRIRMTTRMMLVGLLDAETNQRSYLLTADKVYLEPYERGLAASKEGMRELGLAFVRDPAYVALLADTQLHFDAKKNVLAQGIRLTDAGQSEQASLLVKSGVGKEQMDEFRANVAELLQIETERTASEQASLARTLLINRIGLATLSAVCLLALFLYLRQALILKQRTLDSRRTLQDDRDQLQDEAGISTLMMTELTQHLLTAREDERGRLARDLHDELGALLTSAKLDAARIKSRLSQTATAVPGAPGVSEALERLTHLVGTLNASIALGRTIIEDLRPSTLSNLGLVPTLEILVNDFTEATGVQAHCDLQPVALASSTEIVVYRVMQEAITNISKYAQASQLWVSMKQDAGWVTVSLRDDGIGFDADETPRTAYGLLGMRVRIEAEGGRLTVISQPGQGTSIQLQLPVQCSTEPPKA